VRARHTAGATYYVVGGAAAGRLSARAPARVLACAVRRGDLN
jgi:hypothetical protein